MSRGCRRFRCRLDLHSRPHRDTYLQSRDSVGLWPENRAIPCHRLSSKGEYDTEITRAFDNRPMSSRSQALFRSITEVKPCLAAARSSIQPTLSMQLRPFFRTLDGPGKTPWRGWSE